MCTGYAENLLRGTTGVEFTFHRDNFRSELLRAPTIEEVFTP